MVEYTTKAEMRSFAAKLTLNEQSTFKRQARNRTHLNSTFLSHSSKDEDLVAGAMKILTDCGAKVYIDSVDPDMPPYTSQETAEKLKDRIKGSKKFVLLATANSKDSKWVPWELGAADGFKGLSHISIFPAVESVNDTSWTKWEYIGLYHRIVWGRIDGKSEDCWMVLNHRENTATVLNDWLRN